MSQALHPMLNIAIKAARSAGAIINRASLDLDLLRISSKGPNDFVTEVDQAAEQTIIETLLTAYPGHGILAEESGRTHGAKDSDYVWIIDPLDGTTNFLHGFPVYAVSIALAFRGQVQQAVVYDPTRNDMFYASKGRGAFLNDKRLRVSKRTRMAESLIGTGFPFRKGDNFKRYVQMFEEVMQSCAGLRRPGAAALDLCYVAAGYYDGFFETGLNPWDIAAGSLIITEAGGLIGNFTGEADYLYQREVVAGNPKVYGQLVQILAPYTRAIKADEPGATAAAAAERPPGSRRRRRWPPRRPSRRRRGAPCASARRTQPATTTHRSEPRGSAHGPARDGRLRRPHADDAAVPAHQGRVSRHARLLPDGRLLRALLRRRPQGQPPARHHADHPRPERRRAGGDGRRAGAFGGELPRQADPHGRGRGHLRAGGRRGPWPRARSSARWCAWSRRAR